jgi:hypothetical protein
MAGIKIKLGCLALKKSSTFQENKKLKFIKKTYYL